jgi:hypothetical protein
MIANDGSNDIYVIGGNQLLKYSLDTQRFRCGDEDAYCVFAT